jgi:hypothetical protein
MDILGFKTTVNWLKLNKAPEYSFPYILYNSLFRI